MVWTIKQWDLAGFRRLRSRGRGDEESLGDPGFADEADVAEFLPGGEGQDQADPKVSVACKREAQKYVGSSWEEVLNLMGEDARKF